MESFQREFEDTKTDIARDLKKLNAKYFTFKNVMNITKLGINATLKPGRLENGAKFITKTFQGVKFLTKTNATNQDRIRGSLALFEGVSALVPPLNIVAETLTELYDIVYPKVRNHSVQ